MEFSVLMSLYYKEKAEYFDVCMQSVLNQTVLPSEIIIVLDGPINDQLRIVLESYLNEYNFLIKVVPLEKNVGLGLALKEGIINCSNEIIARMDTDDIARKDRFEIQIQEFEKDPNLDICGSHIIEFENTIDNVIAYRRVPLSQNDIYHCQKRRDAFNHMTVMYKKSVVLKAGNYQDCLLMEDSLLWVNMFKIGAKSCNVDDYLVFARVGSDMFQRRGGYSYFKRYKYGRKKILQTGFISYYDYILTVVVQFVVALMPRNFRELFFKKILHKKK